MIKVSDLKRIKKTCFDRIAQAAVSRPDLAVSIKSVNTEWIEIVMSNGVDFGRILTENTCLIEVPRIEMAWNDFTRVCDVFDNIVEVSVKGAKITFKEGKNKYNCSPVISRFNAMTKFNFNFENAKIINQDNMFILADHGGMGGYGISGEYLISCDSSFAAVNKLPEDFGKDLFLFANKFPPGTWYFAPEQNLIVSEDRQIAMSVYQMQKTYPFEGLIGFTKQHLSNWFEADAKLFDEYISRCSKLDSRINFAFQAGHVIVSARDKDYSDYEVILPVEYEHPTTRKGISFASKYISEFTRCAKDSKIRILFDDSANQHMLRSESDNLIVFGQGLTTPEVR